MMRIAGYKSVASPLFTKLFRKNVLVEEESESLVNAPANSEEKSADQKDIQNSIMKGLRPSLNYPLPLLCYVTKTSHDIVAGTINCICCCPSFESIQDLKDHPYFSHLPWITLAHIDKRTFDILRHHLVTKTKETYGNSPQESSFFSAPNSTRQSIKHENPSYQQKQVDIVDSNDSSEKIYPKYSDFVGYSEKDI